MKTVLYSLTLMQSYVPKSMVDILLELSDVYEKTKLAHLSNKDRWSIVNTLKVYPCTLKSYAL